MKKFIFGLIALVMFGFVGNAQTLTESSSKAALSSQVVTFVNVTKTFYSKGQSYEDFLKALTIPSPTVPSQDIFLKKVYLYVSNNTPDCDILKADNSEFKAFVTDMSKNPRNQGEPTPIAGKKWWQILINAVINIGVEIATGGTVHPNVDLFP